MSAQPRTSLTLSNISSVDQGMEGIQWSIQWSSKCGALGSGTWNEPSLIPPSNKAKGTQAATDS